jgi:hypothetical protein
MKTSLPKQTRLHGIMAEFASADELVSAVRKTRAAGFRRLDAYAPFPVEELPDALGLGRSPIPFIMAAGGFAGAALGYGMQYYATVISYPMNIGGRSLPAWPALIPVSFELTIFGAFLGGLLSLLVAWQLPEVYHPVFNHPDFRRASQDRFFLCIESSDGKFEPLRTAAYLATLRPISVQEVKK